MRKQRFNSLLGKDKNINPFRGCEHGCIYCDSRSNVYNIPGDFSDIIVKENAVELLQKELSKKRKKYIVKTGSMCDPYTISEKKLELTRKLLKVIDDNHFGVSILTKSDLILRDMDLLLSINKHSKAIVCFTLTTTDDALCKLVEPYASVASKRIEALKKFNENGISTGVWMCPILPFIEDNVENIQSIIRACSEVGVKFIINFGMGTTIRDGSREYFYQKLDEKFPGIKAKYQQLFGYKYECPSPRAMKLQKVFVEECNKYNIKYKWEDIKPLLDLENPCEQLSLF